MVFPNAITQHRIVTERTERRLGNLDFTVEIIHNVEKRDSDASEKFFVLVFNGLQCLLVIFYMVHINNAREHIITTRIFS